MLDDYDEQNEVVHLEDDGRLKHDTEDVQIIATLSKENPKPVFVTADLNIYRKYPEERRGLADSGLTCVFFSKSFANLPFRHQVVKAMKAWDQLVACTGDCREPSAFEVGVNGKVTRLGTTSSLVKR